MITYLIEVSICWLLFYSIYLLLLRKETFFNINRWYLLSTLVLGLLIPLFTVEFAAVFYEEPTNSVIYLAEGFSELAYVIEASVEEAKSIEYSWLTFVTLLYILGVIAAFIRFLYGFKQIYGLYKAGNIIKKGNYNLVLTKTLHLPFSFFNYLFWNEDLTLADKDSGKIITHELAHINQWHSLDVLFLEFLGIALWFSPPIYWYKKSLRTVHEYLADAYVLRNTKKKQYGHLLIRQVQSGMQVALANNFIHSQLKQRINMMTRNKSRRKALTRYLPALPLLLLMVLVFSNKNVQKNFNETTAKASSAFEELSPEVLKALVTTEDVRFFDFDAKKAKEQMKIAYRDGSKGIFTESGAAVDWDAQKMKELDRESKRLIAKYPDKESAIIMLTMEVAAENGYSLHYVGESMRYRVIKDFKKGKEITMEIAEENLPTSKVLTDTPPIFPGGEKEMLRFIYTNIKYPADARSQGIYGNLTAQFVVEKDGSLSNLKVKNDLGGGLKEEVFRIMKLVQAMPEKWTPATQNGAAVRSTYELPFAYHLKKENGAETTLLKSGKDAKIVIVGLMKAAKNTPFKKAEAIYKEVDEMPRFTGCEASEDTKETKQECAQMEMLQFIYTNIKYPEAARKAGIEGTVVVKFVVDETGQIAAKEIVRSIGGGTDEAVLAVVDKMPNWIPGKKDGETVSVYYHLPVKFKLAEEAKEETAKQQETTEAIEKPKDLLKRRLPAENITLQLGNKTVIFNAFPNPAKEKLTITLEGEAKDVLLTVFDVTGKAYFSDKIQAFNGTYYKTINLDNIPAGTLIVNVRHKGKDYQKKVIVQ